MRKRLFALLLTLCMALTLLPATAAAAPLLIAPRPNPGQSAWLLPRVKDPPEFPDAKDIWCERYVSIAYQTGLMSGKTETRFDAASPLTYAQITVITARLHMLLRGGDGILPAAEEGQPWYQSAVDHLRKHGRDETLSSLLDRLEQDGNRANETCIRRDFVLMLSAVLTKDILTPMNEVTVIPDVGINAEVYLPFYEAGILTGTDAYGTFGEFDPLTRGAAAAMLSRIADPSQRLTFTPRSFDLCRDVLGVEPNTVMLTVEGTQIPAELFAEQLCVSLRQWEGSGKNALRDAVKFWCHYQGAFRSLAADMDITLSEETQGEIRQTAQAQAGYLGLPAAYWHFREECSRLNLALRSHYIALDDAQGFNGKWGEAAYHSALEAHAETMIQNAVFTEALNSMDLSAVYSRLKNSPFMEWRF